MAEKAYQTRSAGFEEEAEGSKVGRRNKDA